MKKPCRVCGRPQPKAICEACKSNQDKHRGNRHVRGYDSTYDKNRGDMIERAWARGEPCVICGRGFARKADITAEHLVPVRRGGGPELDNLAPAHLACNAAWRRNMR